MLRLRLSLLPVLCLVLASCRTPTPPKPAGPVILVSIDGFRWDYLDKYPAPTLKKLAAHGVQARRMTSSFPTKTFPNHLTLATGLRPEHHGIVSNYFYDPVLGASFNKNSSTDNQDARWWQQGEPIWITAEKQGVTSACYFWPGSEAEIHGHRPSFQLPFNKDTTSNERVDGLLAWLARPEDRRPHFAALYLEVVDVVGHRFGPEAPETAAAVREADTAVARLLDGLARLDLRDTANLVIVSDHGMSETDTDHVIFLEDLMDVSQVEVESTGPNGGVRPKVGSPAELAAHIRALAPPQLQVYLREEVPARYQYKDNPRIPAVVLIADDHWMIESREGWSRLAPQYGRGNHGWDPATPNMGALFVAQGPAFQRGLKLDNVDNVEVYNLLCTLLGLTPAANDGRGTLAGKVLQPGSGPYDLTRRDSL